MEKTKTRSIDLEQFRELLDDELRVFVFLLGDEQPFLESDTHWLNHLEHAKTSLVRCSAEDFKEIEIGRHPKTLVMKQGSEQASFDGIPSQAVLGACLRRVLYESQRTKSGS